VKFANTPLTVAQSLSLDASLAVGAQEQTIEVNGAQVAPIETESAQLSTLVDSKTLLNLSLLTRNPYELVVLSPGAIQTNDTSAGFSVNGSRNRNNIGDWERRFSVIRLRRWSDRTEPHQLARFS
jgi:hypothetical protein